MPWTSARSHDDGVVWHACVVRVVWGDSSGGLFGFVRAAWLLRRIARAQRRPVIEQAEARRRYDPMIVALAAAVGVEFGVEFQLDDQPDERPSPRVYRTPTWSSTGILSDHDDWAERLHRIIYTIADSADETPVQAAVRDAAMRAAARMGADPTEQPPEFRTPSGGDAPEAMTFFFSTSFRDALGGDIDVWMNPDGTQLSIISTVG